jgi:hypothetical protein
MGHHHGQIGLVDQLLAQYKVTLAIVLHLVCLLEPGSEKKRTKEEWRRTKERRRLIGGVRQITKKKKKIGYRSGWGGGIGPEQNLAHVKLVLENGEH